MENLELYNSFRSVPEEAKKKITGGRINGFTDINPMWRIKVLTERFGPCGIGWYFKPVSKWIEKVEEEIAAFVDIELFIKIDGEWSMPISGTGGSKLLSSEKSGAFMSDECYKMATTDALSVACKQIGIGADVYFEKDVTKYSEPPVKQEEKKMTISKKGLEYLQREIERTGADEQYVCQRLKIDKLSDMTLPIFEIAVNILNKTPDKPKTPEEIPESMQEKLPFK